MYVYNRDPVIQVLPEVPLPYGLLNIHIGSGNHPRINGDVFPSAYPLDYFLLKEAKELYLESCRKFPYLIKKKGSGMGIFNLALVSRMGAGEGPFFMSEKF